MADTMDDASLLNISLPDDALQQLLTASGSSSLKEILEILVESSRTGGGRSDLASKNILPTVLRLIQSISYASCRQYLILSLKLLRNLCAGEITSQNSFIESDGVGVVLSIMKSAGLDSDADCGIIRMALQVLLMFHWLVRNISELFRVCSFQMSLLHLLKYEVRRLVIHCVWLYMCVAMAVLDCFRSYVEKKGCLL